MIPYAAQLGLTRDDIEEIPGLEEALKDKYARDCGYDPPDSWVLIVLADGTTEFYALGEGEERWCCNKSATIRKRIGSARNVAPPFVRSPKAVNDQ